MRVPMVMPYEVSIPVAFIEETRDAAAKKLANEVTCLYFSPPN